MARTVVAMFDSFVEAQDAVQELADRGVPRDHISVVGNDQGGEHARTHSLDTVDDESAAAEGAGAGAVGGTVVGGVLGLLVGIGALAIPGIGPIIAAGPLLAALGATAAGAGIGAAAGGLLGALVGAGVPEEDAHLYAEGVRRGGTLVTVTTDEGMATTAYSVLHRHNAVDVDERGTAYREEGWDRFDADRGPYAADSNKSEWDESSKVGTAGGTVAGAATGAAIGSVGGPVGTVIGGVAGAVTGAGVGAAGDAAGEAASDAATGEDDLNRTSGYDTASGRLNDDLDADPRIRSADYSAGTTASAMDTNATARPSAGAYSRTEETVGTAGTSGQVGNADRIRVYDNESRSRVNYDRVAGTTGDSAESNWEESSKVGTAGGTVAGAATGAAIGSVGGPVGTVVGGIAGAVTGAGAGAAGDAAGEAAEDATYGEDDTIVSGDADDASSGRKGQVGPGV